MIRKLTPQMSSAALRPLRESLGLVFLVMQKEIWVPIDGYENLYEISNLGRIKRLHREIHRRKMGVLVLQERILSPGVNKGYPRMLLYDSKGRKANFSIHRLVANAFIPNPDGKPCIDHINGIRTDNRVENLRWCTSAENNGYELARKHISEGKIGRKNGMFGRSGKNSPSHKPVLQYDLDGNFIRKYYGIMEAQRETGVQFKNISKVCHGERYSAGGYFWKYDNNEDSPKTAK